MVVVILPLVFMNYLEETPAKAEEVREEREKSFGAKRKNTAMLWLSLLMYVSRLYIIYYNGYVAIATHVRVMGRGEKGEEAKRGGDKR